MSVQSHFDNIATRYDFFKSKNCYYYSQIKSIYKHYIPANSAVLEIGCGTGDILAELNPRYGAGLDISPEMIEIAKKKHPQHNFHFISAPLAKYQTSQKFDYVFMSDVIEHLENPRETLEELKRFSNSQTIFINNMANPIWEPILLILEYLKMKMPEGPHHRIFPCQFIGIMKNLGWKKIKEEYRCLIPSKLPGSNFVNKYFYKIPIIKRLGLIHVSIFKFKTQNAKFKI